VLKAISTVKTLKQLTKFIGIIKDVYLPDYEMTLEQAGLIRLKDIKVTCKIFFHKNG